MIVSSLKPRLSHVLLLSVLLALVGLSTQQTGAAPTQASTTTQAIIHSDSDGVQLQLTFPAAAISAEGDVSLAGLTQVSSTPGEPALPFYQTLIALPPNATPVLDWQSGLSSERHVSSVRPAPEMDLSSAETDPFALDTTTAIQPLGERYQPNSAVYASDALYPEMAVELSDPMYIRDLRVVELRVYPVRYNPAQQTLHQLDSASVTVTFEGDSAEGQPLSEFAQTHAANVANIDQAQSWGHLPASVSNTEATKLPVGQDIFKITVDEDGIYDIKGSDLSAAGMTLGISANSIQMLSNGEEVAYQFIDQNGNGKLNGADIIRFYGWAFDGSRDDNMYVGKTNVFWLWTGGDATAITSQTNRAGQGYNQVSAVRTSVTAEPERSPFPGYSIDWDDADNDPDNFYWDYLAISKGETGTFDYEIDLPHPTGSGNVDLTVEFSTRINPFASSGYTYDISADFNDLNNATDLSWFGVRNINMDATFNASRLTQDNEAGYPANTVSLTVSSPDSPNAAELYLNRITAEYNRSLIADGNFLQFEDSSGQREYQISGFNNPSSNNAIVWDVTNPYEPVAITMRGQDVSGDTLKVGSNHSSRATFVAATTAGTSSVDSISKVKPTSLDPANGQAQWVVITHPNFKAAAQTLADHREDQGMSTLVVDINQVIMQYGYGLGRPEAINNYMSYAMANWSVGPEYLLLLGDATINPRDLTCEVKCGSWDSSAQNYVLTHLAFRDRINGLIPSDFEFSLISGNDEYADLALGRVPADSLATANDMVDKIILYETQRDDQSATWQKNILFVADDPDLGGDFCQENENTRDLIPSAYNQTHLCLPAPTENDTLTLRNNMSDEINGTGTSILNYRGHGAIDNWAGTSGAPKLLTTANTDFWLNSGKPVIILSADCLDGYFAYPGIDALGETFIRDLGNRGSVAHWSSSGLGFTYEHSILQQGFYEGMFDMNMIRIGDAVNHAKVVYADSNSHESELYSFILLGDPAMKIIPQVEGAGPNGLFLPSILSN